MFARIITDVSVKYKQRNETIQNSFTIFAFIANITSASISFIIDLVNPGIANLPQILVEVLVQVLGMNLAD